LGLAWGWALGRKIRLVGRGGLCLGGRRRGSGMRRWRKGDGRWWLCSGRGRGRAYCRGGGRERSENEKINTRRKTMSAKSSFPRRQPVGYRSVPRGAHLLRPGLHGAKDVFETDRPRRSKGETSGIVERVSPMRGSRSKTHHQEPYRSPRHIAQKVSWARQSSCSKVRMSDCPSHVFYQTPLQRYLSAWRWERA